MDVTVCIGTFGDESWLDLATERAAPSVVGAPVIHRDADTLHHARNLALTQVETEWVIFLDADDELTPGYIDGMSEIGHDVRIPMVQYVNDGRQRVPMRLNVAGHRHHVCEPDCLAFGNYIVIGACVRTQLLLDIGGFRDFPWSEDWDVWLRCHLAGASFGYTRSVYKAHVRADSRNRGATREVKLEAHRAIARANGVPVPA